MQVSAKDLKKLNISAEKIFIIAGMLHKYHNNLCIYLTIINSPIILSEFVNAKDHCIVLGIYYILYLLGGKWTTYRSMAEETMDRAIEECNLKPTNQCVTKGLKLDGAHEWSPTLFIRLIQDFGLDTEVGNLTS